MHRSPLLFTAALVISAWPTNLFAAKPATGAGPIRFAETDWPCWRGAGRDGVANPNQQPPTKWSATQNVLWKSSVPGRGHGSPIVFGDQVLLATAEHDQELQSVVCYDRQSGKQRWSTVVHRGGFAVKGNKKASLASSSLACDGERLFINFLNDGAVYTTALSREGKQLWQTKISDYVIHQGYGSSPALYGPLVIVSADNKGGGAIAGLDRATGDIVWKHARPEKPNYASPIVLRVAGRDQLLFTGCDFVSAFEPTSGERLWRVEGATTECVTSTVTDGRLVFTSGGYPKNHMSAVRADGSGKVQWENTVRVYVPSMLVRDGYLYAVADAGVAMCFRCDTGEEIWKGRLGGTFSASPVLVGDQIYVTNESGATFIFKADPNGFELFAKNQLGDHVMATPAICDSRIYMRVAEETGGQRREALYCLAEGR